MNKYETYKPSGIDWIGDVPENWSVQRIKNISKIVSGSTPSSLVAKPLVKRSPIILLMSAKR